MPAVPRGRLGSGEVGGELRGTGVEESEDSGLFCRGQDGNGHTGSILRSRVLVGWIWGPSADRAAHHSRTRGQVELPFSRACAHLHGADPLPQSHSSRLPLPPGLGLHGCFPVGYLRIPLHLPHKMVDGQSPGRSRHGLPRGVCAWLSVGLCTPAHGHWARCDIASQQPSPQTTDHDPGAQCCYSLELPC